MTVQNKPDVSFNEDKENVQFKAKDEDKIREKVALLEDKVLLSDSNNAFKSELEGIQSSVNDFDIQFHEFRGKFPRSVKKEAIKMVKQKGIDFANRKTRISKNNLEKWVREVPKRKKGGGRKISDFVLEKKIFEWVAAFLKEER